MQEVALNLGGARLRIGNHTNKTINLIAWNVWVGVYFEREG